MLSNVPYPDLPISKDKGIRRSQPAKLPIAFLTVVGEEEKSRHNKKKSCVRAAPCPLSTHRGN
jgi:hypothetical protein